MCSSDLQRDEMCTEFFTNLEAGCYLPYKPFVELQGYEIINEILAKKIIDEKLHAIRFFAETQQHTDFYKNPVEEVKKLLAKFPDLMTDELALHTK